MTKICYAKGPIIYLYDRTAPEKKRSKRKKQLLWGDWLRVGDPINADWFEVKWGKQKFAIHKDDFQEERLLEIIFLDVGQGDGCILTTPGVGDDEKIMIVDAGDRDNMMRFLNWRFRDFKTQFKFHAAIVTHPDADHYRGFQPIFEHENIAFEKIYHNGIVERKAPKKKLRLGAIEDGFVTDLRPDTDSLRELLKIKDNRGSTHYPKLMWTALENGRADSIEMLSTKHSIQEDGRGWLPGFAPSDNPELTIEILGPVVQKAPNGKDGLRIFGKTFSSRSMDNGKTKNGHSVLMRLRYRDLNVLFGGDLNSPAETFLTRHYGNDGKKPTRAQIPGMVKRASERFSVDLMKCCHHGSSDVTEEFLESASPAAYVVSSGDQESHVHPRPDLLGLLGRKGRGDRPLILCTEVLRSTREKEDPELRPKLDKIKEKLLKEEDEEKIDDLEKERDTILDLLFKRNVGVYGAINLRTDGRRAVVAFRNEKGSDTNRWFYYEMEKDPATGQMLPKAAGH